MTRIALIFLVSGLLIGASECDRDPPAGDGGADEGEGSAGTSGEGSGDREPCGTVTCDRGEVCCNESCGICTPPNGACTQQFCTPEDAGTSGDAPFCGGIAGIACPGAGMCVDDPGDDCDPEHGGADCGGLCRCGVTAMCNTGLVFDNSPEVCTCVPAGGGGKGVKCGPSTCAKGEVCCNESCGYCTAPGESCTEEFCGGVPGGEECGNVTCDAGQVCCNASCGICTEPGGFCTQQACEPDDEEPRPGEPCDLDCDPGQHCEYIEVQCIQAPCPPQPECVDDTRCGGFAGLPCPGAGSCADDPGDDCDPENGGADCGGVCECNAIGLCVDGTVWNPSPSVCGCEGEPTGGGGAECGNVTCPAGQECCNASCGICTDPGGACIQIACL
jgi:hypothetical protein